MTDEIYMYRGTDVDDLDTDELRAALKETIRSRKLDAIRATETINVLTETLQRRPARVPTRIKEPLALATFVVLALWAVLKLASI